MFQLAIDVCAFKQCLEYFDWVFEMMDDFLAALWF